MWPPRPLCPPAPSYGRLFVIFLVLFLTPDWMNICVVKWILHKKNAIFCIIICKRLVPLDNHLQPPKGHEKRIFGTLHNEIKSVLSIKSNFNKKMGQNFHICFWSGLMGLTPTSSPLTVSVTVKYPFFSTVKIRQIRYINLAPDLRNHQKYPK